MDGSRRAAPDRDLAARAPAARDHWRPRRWQTAAIGRTRTVHPTRRGMVDNDAGGRCCPSGERGNMSANDALTGELRRQVSLLEMDLRNRVEHQPEVLGAWKAEHDAARKRSGRPPPG